MINRGQIKKVALVHDSFTQMGGAERVIEALHEIYPNAAVYTLVFDKKYQDRYRNWNIRTSWLQIFYNFAARLQYLLPFIPLAVASLKFARYDIVISSSSGFVKNIHLPKNVLHINYCHTPARFLWTDKDYINQEVPALIRPLVRLLLKWMRKWDYTGAQRVNFFIANSREVQNRISVMYHRTSTVIHAPVDTEFWKPTIVKKDYFLIVGRLQAHKGNEIIIKIFNDLGLPLHVVGTGRQAGYLKNLAKANIVFLGRVSDEQLRDEYCGALGVIYPQIEDFGLVPLEAAACGTATLAYGKGGALETIIPGVTGELFESYDENQIKNLILNWQPQKYSIENLRQQAEKFGKEKFKENIDKFFAQLSL